MAEVQVVASNGRVKDKFNTNIDAKDEQGCMELMRKYAPKGGSIRVKGKKGWVIYK